MSEKDDILGLAFLVGGAINDLKVNTIGDGKFVSQSLDNPADFVRKVAAQDISKVVEEGKRQQAGAPPPPPAQAPLATVGGNSAEALLTETVRLLGEIQKTLSQIASKVGM